MRAPLPFRPTRGTSWGSWALARLVTHPGAKRRPFRSALWSGGLIALSSTPAIALLARTSAADSTDILALRVLAYASWLVGAFGSWAFLTPAAEAQTAGALARARGFSGTELGQLWTVGVAVRLGVAVFLVTLLPLGVSAALSPTRGMLLSRLLLIPAVAAYAALLGGSLALLCRFSRQLTPGAPRSTLAALVLLPFFASFWFPAIVSFPGIFGWLIDGLIALGGWSA